MMKQDELKRKTIYYPIEAIMRMDTMMFAPSPTLEYNKHTTSTKSGRHNQVPVSGFLR